MKELTAKIVENFRESVQRGTGCWRWLGETDKAGNPMKRIKGKRYNAQRIAWIIRFGDLDDNIEVQAKCKNPQCMNPQHLFIEGQKKTANGESHYRAKLTDVDVVNIRKQYAEEGMTQAQLATMHGVRQPAIYKIVHGKTWKHL